MARTRVRGALALSAEFVTWLRISFVEHAAAAVTLTDCSSLVGRCVGELQAAVDAAAEHVVAVEDFVAVNALAVFCR